eukprot:scpid91669/ scgid23918/ 
MPATRSSGVFLCCVYCESTWSLPQIWLTLLLFFTWSLDKDNSFICKHFSILFLLLDDMRSVGVATCQPALLLRHRLLAVDAAAAADNDDDDCHISCYFLLCALMCFCVCVC